MYDLLQLSESGPSVMRKKIQQIEIKLVSSIGMLPTSLKSQSVQLQSAAHIIKNIFFKEMAFLLCRKIENNKTQSSL